MLTVPFGTVFHQFGVLIHHDELVLDRNCRHLDAQQLRGALSMVARSGHDMLGTDDNLLVTDNKVSAFFNHFGQRHIPVTAFPFKTVRLPFPLDHDAPLTGTFRHRLRHVRRVNITVRIVVNRALQIFGIDQRPTRLDFIGGQKLVRDTTGFSGRCIEPILVHPLVGLRHTQVANNRKASIETSFFFERFVKIDRILVNVGCCIGHIEQRQKTGRMPGRSRRKLITFDQHHIVPASFS